MMSSLGVPKCPFSNRETSTNRARGRETGEGHENKSRSDARVEMGSNLTQGIVHRCPYWQSPPTVVIAPHSPLASRLLEMLG